ncbi:integral membrane protein [Moelleriella libera RCEF 2490]|uniref:Integral membrane protein n=1 Tax=Moelleriella libera RCEF 2490 TaxID=1081109 RepID=A0A166V313_9HYPO|nr:integral membrane protein [Moelleriella libera RCEF 2490]
MLRDELAPPGGDVDRGPDALITFWTTAGISVVVVGLRFVGRRLRRQTGLDDWIMLLTLILYVVFVSILTKYITVGGLRHLYYLTPEERVIAAKWGWISQPFVIMGFATGKLSVAVLLWRVVGSTTFWRKWFLCFATISALLISIVNIVLTFTQCSPVEALWNQQLLKEGQTKCLSPSIQINFAIFLSSWNILTDVFLAALPASFMYKLDLSTRKKVGLSILLGLGATSAIFAGIKTMFLTSLGERSDVTWSTYQLYVWSGVELFVIILCGSVPPVKPVWDILRGKPRISTVTVTSNGRRESDLSTPSNKIKPRRNSDRSISAIDDEIELQAPVVAGDAASERSATSSLHLHPRQDNEVDSRP